MQTPDTDAGSHWVILLAIAGVSTVSAVWGYDMVACRGLIAGAVSTAMKLGFLVFVSPPALAMALLLFAAFGGIGLGLAALPIFRDRKELLLFLLPVTVLFISVVIAMSGHIPIRCALSPWR